MNGYLMNTISRIPLVFNNVFGWLLAVVTGFVAWLGDEGTSLLIVLVAIGWDLIWGVAAAVKNKKFILSHLLRETFYKVLVYIGSLLIILVCERSLNDSWGVLTRVVAVIAACIELFSAAGNILIIKPNFAFVRLFKKYLIGEIAEKLNIGTDEAETIINTNDKKEE
jgi:hypothetical protein